MGATVMYDTLTESIKSKWNFKPDYIHFRSIRRRTKLYQHTCKHCGKDFSSKSMDSKWCSKKCENDQRKPYKKQKQHIKNKKTI